MQYSPYRLQLAGVRTAVVDYLPLAKKVSSYGLATLNEQPGDSGEASSVSVDVQLPHDDAALVRMGQEAEISCTARPGQGPWHGHVASVSFESEEHPTSANVRVDIADPQGQLSRGMVLLVKFDLPLADVEPFRSQPADPEPLLPDEPRRVFVCPNHPDVIRLTEGKCPRDRVQLREQQLADNERLSYWCPMHPEVTSRVAGHKCEECGGMTLLPRVTIYRPGGRVLAVPDGAVIDTGTRRLVYVDRGDGMFDGVEIEVGPRAAGYYAVVSGLEAGQRVAASGAFLLDAETRLNANAASSYFGATTASGVGSEASSGATELTP
jgi:Cu(I)/Ag(I) efflux system membrane fusion protein